MKRVAGCAAAALVMVCATQARAQTADEVIEKYLAAIGGRAALAKLDSRIARGTISVSTQGVDLTGSVELFNKAPNKSRTYTHFDLSQFGAGEIVVERRCDGKTGYSINTMQGDREITGDDLQSMLDARFPTPFLGYKEAGAKVELTGKDKVGDRTAYVVQYTPKTGWATREYIDAETYQPLRMVTTVSMPDVGQMEQTTDFQDYREVDGIKVPFALKIFNSMQAITISLQSVEHNKPIDEAMFSKPAAK